MMISSILKGGLYLPDTALKREVIKQDISEDIYHTPYPLETMEFLFASTQFFLDDAVFRWNPEELATRVRACARIIEFSLGAAEGSFQFLSGNLGPESREATG